MNNEAIATIVSELQDALLGQRFGRIFPLSKRSMAIDFRLASGSYLFISLEPADPKTFLIKRRLRDLEKQSGNFSPFLLKLRASLTGFRVTSISKFDDERTIIFEFTGESEISGNSVLGVAVQLTGRSANLFLLDDNRAILDRFCETRGPGQQIGTEYSPPIRTVAARTGTEPSIVSDGRPLSERLDEKHLADAAARSSELRAEAARKKLRSEVAKKTTLMKYLHADLKQHGDGDKWKRFGDLLLANARDAKRQDNVVVVTDYFDEALPRIEIDGDADSSISEIAETYFKRYTKARNAATEIARRLNEIEIDLARLALEEQRLEQAIEQGDESFFSQNEKPKTTERRKRSKDKNDLKGARTFVSSDGYEILVGKKAKDNDLLTFRVAKSLDLWLHAADYPGSHVVVRNSTRKEIPHATLVQAAELAAFYSDAREQTKAAVNYTQKKFVNKPRGAAPGLVSLSSFKTILVRPQVSAKQKTPS